MNDHDGATRAAKRKLRARMRAERLNLSAREQAQRSARMCERLVAMPQFQAAQAICAYVAFRAEIDPAGVLERAEQLGKTLALVRTERHSGLHIHRYTHATPLRRNAIGLLEPGPDAEALPAQAIDLIVVPALAVDPGGGRLGYGGGYYDRLLPQLEHADKVAVVYDFQCLDAVPGDEHDAAVDFVVSDVRVLRCRR